MRPTRGGILGQLLPIVLVLAATSADAAVVVVYQDPAFVDPPFVHGNTGDRDDPVANIERGLELYGHSVVSVSDSAAASFSTALTTADVLLVAPLREDLGTVIDPGAAAAIEAFVSGGGGLVIHVREGFTAAGEYPFGFLEAVFGITGLALDGTGVSYLRTAAADSTAFVAGPERVLGLSLVRGSGITTASLPAGALSLYEVAASGNGGAGTAIARFAYGAGRIVYLGYSWELAWPFRHLDLGWVEALGRAIEDVLGCGDPGAADGDGDGIADACDNCPATNHAVNTDCDEDGIGDVCDGDTIDADGDGRDDACDPCVDVAGARTLDRSKLRIKSAVGLDGSFDLKGQFVLPAGSSFADIDPLSSRIRIRATDDVERVVLDTTLPAVAYGEPSVESEKLGWRGNNAGTRWVYKRGRPFFAFDLLTYYGGVHRAKLRDASTKAPGLVKLVIKTRAWPIDAAGVVPLQADVAVGDASLGRCTETAFVAADCKVGTNVTTCK